MSRPLDLVRALGLVCDEIERHGSDGGAVALLREVGRRLLAHPDALNLLGVLAWHRELRRFRRLATHVHGVLPFDCIDDVDRLLARALQGKRLDLVEAAKLTQTEWSQLQFRRGPQLVRFPPLVSLGLERP